MGTIKLIVGIIRVFVGFFISSLLLPIVFTRNIIDITIGVIKEKDKDEILLKVDNDWDRYGRFLEKYFRSI